MFTTALIGKSQVVNQLDDGAHRCLIEYLALVHELDLTVRKIHCDDSHTHTPRSYLPPLFVQTFTLFFIADAQAQEFQFVVDSLTKKHCRDLSAHILANNLTPSMYATQWFLTAFTQRFPYDLVTRVWDMFLLEDWKVFYRVCLALFK